MLLSLRLVLILVAILVVVLSGSFLSLFVRGSILVGLRLLDTIELLRLLETILLLRHREHSSGVHWHHLRHHRESTLTWSGHAWHHLWHLRHLVTCSSWVHLHLQIHDGLLVKQHADLGVGRLTERLKLLNIATISQLLNVLLDCEVRCSFPSLVFSNQIIQLRNNSQLAPSRVYLQPLQWNQSQTPFV